eukprot:439704-Pelagomonas_calceolata.AAC.2
MAMVLMVMMLMVVLMLVLALVLLAWHCNHQTVSLWQVHSAQTCFHKGYKSLVYTITLGIATAAPTTSAKGMILPTEHRRTCCSDYSSTEPRNRDWQRHPLTVWRAFVALDSGIWTRTSESAACLRTGDSGQFSRN